MIILINCQLRILIYCNTYIICRNLEIINALIKSESVSSDSLGELEISGHDGDSLGMNSAEVGVFEKRYQISFSSFLEGQNS